MIAAVIGFPFLLAFAWFYEFTPEGLKRESEVARGESIVHRTGRKEADKVFEWLDRAWSARDPGISGLLFDPLILPYKEDPRFAAYCRKVGLPRRGEKVALNISLRRWGDGDSAPTKS